MENDVRKGGQMHMTSRFRVRPFAVRAKQSIKYDRCIFSQFNYHLQNPGDVGLLVIVSVMATAPPCAHRGSCYYRYLKH
jgi:hypothetical protein